jgi:hypothetical protein
MVFIVFGILCFIFSALWADHKKKKDGKKIGITNLTDFELKPIDQQNMGYEDAVSFFNSARSMITK